MPEVRRGVQQRYTELGKPPRPQQCMSAKQRVQGAQQFGAQVNDVRLVAHGDVAWLSAPAAQQCTAHPDPSTCGCCRRRRTSAMPSSFASLACAAASSVTPRNHKCQWYAPLCLSFLRRR